MKLRFCLSLNLAMIMTLLGILSASPDVLAQQQKQDQEHVVSAADLHRDLIAVARARESNLAKVQSFFSTDRARKALKSANLPYQKVQNAVSSLNDEELARLAARTEKVQADLAAGSLTNQQITYIIIALATAVVVLILVAAR